ncbi:DAPG hydrolase family protein [Nocardia niwae]|uniref:DAPG hydrolase PhiG domain-containing protein n=1 Tax=Nocardia niwae TaxID=626084 RepID=A0ABV2X7M8_9NOCA
MLSMIPNVGAIVMIEESTGTGHAAPAGQTRYRGYSSEDRLLPYARFFADRTLPVPAEVAVAYAGPATDPRLIPEFDGLPGDLSPSGYSAVETGYGYTRAGAMWVAVRTVMPGVTAAMWDWWFGWHIAESARYKLWHPDAHLHVEAAQIRTTAGLGDRDRYIGNTAYVDEYIGAKLQQLAISFHAPALLGLEVPDDHTIILGRVGSSVAPLDVGWLAHQVRPTPGGCEMRSRFYLNLYGPRVPDAGQAARAVARGAALDPADLALGLDWARELLLHCGQEMNHLAAFLPELYREFASQV